MYREVFFDLETKKLFGDVDEGNPSLLGASIVSLWERTLNKNLEEVDGALNSFWESDFEQMWKVFQNADRIIGFNSIGFDSQVLKPYVNFPFEKLPHFDIMGKFKDAVGHRISLDALTKETLGREKTDVGINAVYYYQKGDAKSLAKLKKYCENDVIITKDLYDFILKNGYVLYKDKWNTPRKVELDFSYPKKETEESQIGLF